MLARTAAQVAHLSNQHPRHGRHTVCFSSTMLRCSVAVFLSRLITVYHEEQVELLNCVFVFAPCKRPPHSTVNIHYEPTPPAGCCYRRQWAGPNVSLRHTLRDAARPPVLKMSRADTTNSQTVNRDCFRTFPHSVRHGRML